MASPAAMGNPLAMAGPESARKVLIRPEKGSPARFSALDGLRGLAAVSVLLHHAFLAVPSLDRAFEWRVDAGDAVTRLLAFTPVHVLWAGQQAVIFFFVLSGFVLALGFLDRPVPPSISAFLTRRVCRIYLPYMAVMMIAMVLLAALWSRAPTGVSPWFNTQWNRAPLASDVLAIVAMNGSSLLTVDSPSWSLAHEMRVALVFPLMMVVVQRSKWFHLLAIAIVLSVLARSAIPESVPTYELVRSLQYGALFLIGAVLAKHRRVIATQFSRLAPWEKVLAIGVALALYDGAWHWHITPAWDDLLTAFGSVIAICVVLGSQRLQRVLTRPTTQWLGKISYSLYLSHVVVLLAAIHLTQSLWSGLLFGVPLALLTAAILHRLVELPSQHLGRRVAGRLAI